MYNRLDKKAERSALFSEKYFTHTTKEDTVQVHADGKISDYLMKDNMYQISFQDGPEFKWILD